MSTDSRRAIDISEPPSGDPLYPDFTGAPLYDYTVVCELYDADTGLRAVHVTAPNVYEAQIAAIQFLIQGTRAQALVYRQESTWTIFTFEGHCKRLRNPECPHLSTLTQEAFCNRMIDVNKAIDAAMLPLPIKQRIFDGISLAGAALAAANETAFQLRKRVDAIAESDDKKHKAAERGTWPPADQRSPFTVVPAPITD